MKDDLVDYITDRFATFLARCLLHLLSGTLAATKPPATAASGGLTEKLARVQHLAGATVVGTPGGEKKQHAATHVAPSYAQHISALAQVFLGPAVDDESLVTLQRSTTASPFLQALLPAVEGLCDSLPRTLLVLPAWEHTAQGNNVGQQGAGTSPSQSFFACWAQREMAQDLPTLQRRASTEQKLLRR